MNMAAINLPSFFTQMSTVYSRNTGNVTKDLFAQLVPRLAPITASSVIHDNASGPATATSVLLSEADIASQNPKFICTDMVPAMIDGATELAQKHQWTTVSTKVMKSDLKMDFEDDTFTHSITNFSIFNFEDRVTAISEIYRTLKPGGQVVITTWDRWAAGDVIRAAQTKIRPDLPLMQSSGPDMYDATAVQGVMVKGGFEKAKLEVVQGSQVVSGEDLEGHLGFLKSKFIEGARKDWSEQDKARWNDVIDEIVELEKKQSNGGLEFTMYAVIGTK